MLILTKSLMAIMIGFILSLITAFILIPILKKLKIRQSLSVYLERSHTKKQGTPTMGGLIFIIPTILTIVLLLILKKITINYSLLIVLFSFIGYALIGFIDDYLIVIKHNNKGLSEKSKFLMQVVIAIIFFYLFMMGGNEPLLWIHAFNLKLSIGWF